MKILTKSKISSASKRKTFPAAVKDLAEKDRDGKVVIYEKAGVRSRYLDEISILDATDIAPDVERAISEQYGGGNYQLCLVKSDSELVDKYQYSIAGQPKGRRSNALLSDTESRREKTTGSEERYYRVLEKLADVAIGGRSSADDWQRTLELARELRGDGSDKDFQREVMGVLLSNVVEGKGSDFDNALRIIELSNSLRPEIQKEDPLTALIGGILPLITQLAMSRKGGGQPQLDPEQRQQLQAYLGQLQGADALQHPPAPGGTEQTQAPTWPPRAGETAAQAQQPPESEPAASEPSDQTVSIIDSVLVPQFRQRIRQKAPPSELAYEIVKLIQTAAIWDPEHALFKDLINESDLQKLNAAIDKFLAAMPELIENGELTAQVKAELARITIAMLGMDEGEEKEAATDDDSEPQPLDDISGPESTQAESSTK